MKKAIDELKRASKKRSHSRRDKEGREGGVDVLPPLLVFVVSFFSFFPPEEVKEERRRRQATEGAKARRVAPRLCLCRACWSDIALTISSSSLPPSLPPSLPT